MPDIRQQPPPDLRRLAPVASLSADPGNDLASINTWKLPSGAMCWVVSDLADYVFDRFSTQAPVIGFVVAPAAGPGRWFKKDELMLPDWRFDAYGRLRVSEPNSVFDAKTIYDDQALRLLNATASGGTALYQSSRSSTLLSVTTTIGSKATRQTKRYLNYQPGKSLMVFATFVMTGGGAAGIQKRVGYFDDGNGLFFQLNGTTLQMVRRSNVSGSVVDEVVDRAAWNLDTLDGNGESGVTLDVSKAQILVVDFQWLGTGRVRIGFDIDGQVVFAHEFLAANALTSVYMQTPNLPVRWQIETTAAAVAGSSIESICCSVVAEGGMSPAGVLRSADMHTTTRAVGVTLTPLMSIRLKAAYNRASVFPKLVQILEVGNTDTHWEVRLNPTITGGSAAVWTSVPNSAVEYDVTRNGTMNQDGVLIVSGYLSKDISIALAQSLESQIILASDIAGTPDELVVGVQTLSASDSFAASMQWLEQS